ncbi:RDD family protein [uncultured Bacteroides sp.]|uniref:RDD family protein n=1 Tax=uncultured Bacteroides sp. TaxID=162156 RepID=UPI002AAB9779|nr:RDD family protein [uncultured Bacteroides sp.]
MANTTIITGQYVRINQTPASAGERILARLIDFVIIILYIYATTTFLRKSGFLSLFNDTSLVFFLLAVYLPVYGYSFLFETFNHGQSIGKRIMNIRVAMVDGSTPTLGSYLLRWLLFLVDFTITGGLGLIFILMTKNSQRIGDLAAGTMVIRLNNYKKTQVSLDEYAHLEPNYHPVFPQAGDLSLEQINVIENALNANEKERDNYITQLSVKIRGLLSINTPMDDEKFLETLIKDYQYYAYVDI